ncbi:MAG: hypothetical protein PVJ14_00770 [Chromatiales bacterium]|jgi:hypothetical protein
MKVISCRKRFPAGMTPLARLLDRLIKSIESRNKAIDLMLIMQSVEVGWINNLPFFKAVFHAGKTYKIPRSYAFPVPES